MATHFVDVGKQWVVDRINGTPAQTDMDWVAWGTGGATAATESDTALATEAAESRVQGTMTQETTTVTGDTYQVVGTLTSASSQTIDEAGLFDASTGGEMLIRGDFTGIALTTDDSIEFTFTLHVDQA